MSCPIHPRRLFLCLLISLTFFVVDPSSQHIEVKKKQMREKVREMFYHAYDNYMTYAFPVSDLL
jgi:mannosidase alpha-like ER degradation enhancer 1